MINPFIDVEKELVLDALFIDRLRMWETKISKAEKYEKILSYIGYANLRFLGYYGTKDIIDAEKEKKASTIFRTLLDDMTFIEQVKDLNITIDLFFPKRFIDNKKKILLRSIIATYANSYDKIKRKVLISNIENMMRRYNYLWLLFMIKYYKNYLS